MNRFYTPTGGSRYDRVADEAAVTATCDADYDAMKASKENPKRMFIDSKMGYIPLGALTFAQREIAAAPNDWGYLPVTASGSTVDSKYTDEKVYCDWHFQRKKRLRFDVNSLQYANNIDCFDCRWVQLSCL